MGWLEGVLTGYANRHYEIEQQKRDDAAKAAEQQGKVFDTLLNSKYPEIKALAGAGILDLANPRRRKGGIAGWMGELEQSPYLDMVRRAQQRYVDDPEYGWSQYEGGGPSLPSISTPAGSLPRPSATAPPLAQPSTNAVDQGPRGAPLTPPTPAPTGPGGPVPPRSLIDRGAPPPPPLGGPPDPFAPPPGYASAPLLDVPQASAAPPPAPPAMAAAESLAPPVPPSDQVATVGRQAPPPARRTQLAAPSIFPTAADAQVDQARAAVWGKVRAYADMYEAQGFSEPEAWQKAAQLLEADLTNAGSRSSLQNTPMEFDVRSADGTTKRVMGWADRRTQQYLDINGRPFGPDVVVTKAAPYSAFTGDTWARMAMTQMGVHPGQLIGNPALAKQVNDLATELSGDRASHLTTERGLAAGTIPLSSSQRINQMAEWQNKYNSYQAPLRIMEQNLRNAAAAYAELKKGNMAAWEPFRVATVHVNEQSVVMPSEFARAGGIGSLMERIEGQIQQWLDGGGPLPEGLIDEMMQASAAQWEAAATYDANFRSQVQEALKDPALEGIRPEQIFGAPRPRFDPWTIATPNAPPTPPPVTPTTPTGGTSGVPGGTGTRWDPATRRFVRPGAP